MWRLFYSGGLFADPTGTMVAFQPVFWRVVARLAPADRATRQPGNLARLGWPTRCMECRWWRTLTTIGMQRGIWLERVQIVSTVAWADHMSDRRWQ
jgi:hypothetical protein